MESSKSASLPPSHEPSDRGDSPSNSKDVPVTTNSREGTLLSVGHRSSH